MKRIIFLLPLTFIIACSGSESNENDESKSAETTTEEKNEIVMDLTLTKVEQADLPGKCEYKGNLVDAHSWSDKNGKNYFIRTITEIEYGEESGATDEESWSSYGSQNLYAYHYATNSEGELEEMRMVQDYVDMCEFDIMMSHEINSLRLTDINQDSLAEVSFIYRLACTSDVSPSTQKLLLLENGIKYILRGNTQVEGFGGEFEIDESFDNAPAGFLSHCESLWAQHLTEYDFEM
ncbi:MAG: hypothetical protein MK078_08470 [Crocinitomicaceae bacterium]|nr:hypothetical protein [Crocinitomicaceae bacterium]